MVPYACFTFLCWIKFLVVVLDRPFIWEKKKGLLVVLNRWSSYAVMTVFAWVNSALVILHEWSSYTGGCLDMFDGNH